MQHALSLARASVDQHSLLHALSTRDHRAAESAVDPAVTVLVSRLRTHLPEQLHPVFVVGAKVALDNLKRTHGLRISMRANAETAVAFNFDATNPRAAAWAREHVGALLDDLSTSTIDNLRETIAEVFDGDLPAEDAAALIVDAIGDDARADRIARTETMTAANEGQRETWDQAVEAGLLSGNERVVWIAAGDACDDCEDMDGETVGVDEEFEDGGPPLHPNCRCTVGLN